MNRHNKTLLTFVVVTSIAMMFILGSSSSFPNTARSKLSHVSKIATATINLISVGGPHSIFNAASNPTISTGQFSSVTSNSHVKSNDKSNNNKVIVLSFDDNRIGDFTYAKPILDKYGFKATFFVICGKTTDSGAMNWQDIAAMQKDGMDIESHTMTHVHLNHLSATALNFQIAGSKQCLASHGYNVTTFAYPYNEGSNNATVVNIVAKYYNIARSGTQPLMFLDCKGYSKHPQTDCRTYTSDGKLTYANRYAARSLSFDVIEINDSFDNSTIYSAFVKIVNSQSTYNQGGKINAVPLITFHNISTTTNHPYYTNAGLFDQLMKYLHDNGFKVLTFKQLGYSTQNNTFYLKGVS